MLSSKSRYLKSGTSVLTAESGKQIIYINRRILPKLPSSSYSFNNNISSETENTTISVSAGDRLDNISARTIGDPEQFWKICDVNDYMHPLDLTLIPGKQIVVPTSTGGLALSTQSE